MNARHVTSTRHVFDPSIYTLLTPSLPLCRARLPFHSSRPRNRRVRRVGCAAEYGVARISWRNTWRSFLPANEGEFWICRACHFLKILPLDPALRRRAYKFREGTRDYWDSVTEIGVEFFGFLESNCIQVVLRIHHFYQSYDLHLDSLRNEFVSRHRSSHEFFFFFANEKERSTLSRLIFWSV